MSFEMQQAIALLKDLLWLKTADLGAEDRRQADVLVNDMLQSAIDDANRLLDDWTREVAAVAQRVADAQEKAAKDVIAAEKQAAVDAVKAEADAAQREERQRAGIS